MVEPHTVVVGVDGSEPSLLALRWAAGEARRGGGELRVVHAYQWHTGTGLRPDDAVAAERAADLVAQAVAMVRAIAPTVAVSVDVMRRSPAAALLSAADEARLVVVGSRGRGGSGRMPLGSVSLRVATHAPCPVAVIRTGGCPHGPVVIGLDGSAAATVTVPAGFDLARGAGGGLIVAHAVRGAPDAGRDNRIRDDLVAAVTPWQVWYPDVEVRYVVATNPATNPAASVLTGLSRHASALVVGDRGHSGFTGLLLGSTSQRLLATAACPVLVARAGRA